MASDKISFETKADATRVEFWHDDKAVVIADGAYSTSDPALIAQLDEHPGLKRAETSSSSSSRSSSLKE